MNKRSALRYLLLAALALAPMALAGAFVFPGLDSPGRFEWPGSALFNGLEILIYCLALIVSFRRMELLTVAGAGFVLAAVRGLSCGAAAFLAAYTSDAPVQTSQLWLSLWAGSQELAAAQVAVMVLVALPLLGAYYPGLVGERDLAAEDHERANSFASLANKGGGGHATQAVAALMGGSMQLSSYQEFEGLINRVPHMIGYTLASDEGLIVCADGRRLSFALESTVPRLQIGLAELDKQQRRCGLSGDVLTQRSADYTVIYCRLKPCFHLIMFFASDVPLDEAHARIASIRNSAEAFLVDRHRPLAVAMQAKADRNKEAA